MCAPNWTGSSLPFSFLSPLTNPSLLSLADACRAFNYRRPIMVDENVIIINGGRHPLQEQVVDTFVANDTRLAGGLGAHVQMDSDDGDEETDGGRGKPYNAHACTVCVEMKKRGEWMDGWMDGEGKREDLG